MKQFSNTIHKSKNGNLFLKIFNWLIVGLSDWTFAIFTITITNLFKVKTPLCVQLTLQLKYT